MPKVPHKSQFTILSQVQEQYLELSCIPHRTKQQERKLVGIVRLAQLLKASEEALEKERVA